MKRQDPDFWNDPKAAELIEKSIRTKEKLIKEFEHARQSLEDLQVLFDFFKEGEAEEVDLEAPMKFIVKPLSSFLDKTFLPILC